MSEGLVTFFKYKQLGFHKRGDSYYEPLMMADMLESLHTCSQVGLHWQIHYFGMTILPGILQGKKFT